MVLVGICLTEQLGTLTLILACRQAFDQQWMPLDCNVMMMMMINDTQTARVLTRN